MRKLNIIGAGRAGRALGRVFSVSRAFVIGDIFDCVNEAAEHAAASIGAGRAVRSLNEMHPADVWMLTPSDDQIVACGKALAASGLLQAGNVVFQCSGASPSHELAAVVPFAIAVASVHPLRTFADPAMAAQTFAGTYCAAEGDVAALDVLRPALEASGARVSLIEPQFKTIYHAASVIVCNYLTALMEAGLRGYAKAGLERDDALRMMEPLVRETLDNVFRLGTVEALTGPIARGDGAVVMRQVAALAQWDPKIEGVYRQLGRIAVELAQARAKADAAALEEIERVLTEKK
jgi:predicted short-subunit dehydrogenase-like oxidoreductase (DUF2520 family)